MEQSETMNKTLRIGDLIEVPPVQTVIRLEDGKTGSEFAAQSFVFTDEVKSHFSILADALAKDHGRGFFLQGDFGSGKSHFLVTLATWISNRAGADWLCRHHPALRKFTESKRRLLPVDVSLVNYRAASALEKILVEAVEAALAAHGVETRLTPLSAFLVHFKSLLRTESMAEAFAEQIGIAAAGIEDYVRENPRACYVEAVRFMKQMGLKAPEALLEERHETLQRVLAATQQAGFDGLVLIIDELSEFFRSKPDARSLNEDARTLQLLGELADTQPVWIIAAVQESIERTGDIAQVTFLKIKDRFPVKLVLSTLHIKALISRRLVKHRESTGAELYRIYEYLRLQFPSFSWRFEEFQAAYPVHPATIDLLNGLGDLFSEHRGIVDFVHFRIAGDPGRQIPGVLDRPSHVLLGPDSIYDHFCGRMAEFSALHVYPKYVVPHLDEVIERAIDDPEDRALARRIVRVLVLYAIHPTAELPGVRMLTELVSWTLSEQDPDLSVRFVAEAILDVLVRESRFLIKKDAGTPESDPLESVYAVVAQEDPAKTFKNRLSRAASEIPLDDHRLLLEPLSELPESASWPGPTFLERDVFRTVGWCQSNRRALISFLRPGDENGLSDRIRQSLGAGECDFAVIFGLGKIDFKRDHTAVWEIPLPLAGGAARSLRDFLAARQLCSVLRTTHPAEAPLIQPAKETVKLLTSEAGHSALDIFYGGNFSDTRMDVEPVVRQMRRFDRLLEVAGEVLLEIRYPGYRKVAPRKGAPSRFLYQRLIDEFISVGSIGLRDAHTRGLSDAIEGLAAPLGLVELRSGSYVFAPDPDHHPLLASIFDQLGTAIPTDFAQLVLALQTGWYGLPKDTALFLISALAHGGLITLLKNGRAIPLELLRMTSVETADALAPGEVITRHDRDTFIESCPFLAPASGWTSFGLRQQREVWQNTVKFKEWAQKTAIEMESRLASVAEFSAFKNLDIDSLLSRLKALSVLSAEIKVSYPARNGLERFLSAWRESGLSAADIDLIKKMRTFLSRHAESFVFVNHYVRHSAVMQTAAEQTEIAVLQRAVLELLDQPEALIREENHSHVMEAFERFRTEYARVYGQVHADYYRRSEKKPLSKFAARANELLQRLASIEILDRPAGLKEVIGELTASPAPTCKRNLAEELLRSPVCNCGLLPGSPMPPVGTLDLRLDPDRAIEKCLIDYLGIMKRPEIREALSARIFALADADPDSAKRLRSLNALLENAHSSPAALLDILDESTAKEISRALSGRVSIERRPLADLTTQLGGRRLAPGQVREIIDKWMSVAGGNTVIAIDEDGSKPAAEAGMSPQYWWSMLHSDLFTEDPGPGAREIESILERQFPAADLRQRLFGLDEKRLLRFLTEEPFHTHALQVAWQLLAERIISGAPLPHGTRMESRHADRELAGRINTRLAVLDRMQSLKDAPLPAALRLRIPLDAVLSDPWASAELRSLVRNRIGTLAKRGEDWLSTLSAAAPLALAENPMVVVVDGVSPDVWMEAKDALKEACDAVSGSWYRLEVRPDTASSMSALFGFAGDALDELASRGIDYLRIKGNEARGLIDLLPANSPEKPVVVSISLVDEAAHSALIPLYEMPGMLANLLNRELPRLRKICREQRRRLILTTDHGLTLGSTGLTHGRGGVYERALFRAEWGAHA
ncbi:MAG: hypothetical protein C4530_18700 [Desulfobacteraceae bacterium]|nr:MAG: hypothetical protein C4530_18700 [Desulfobacteraceae bacterium]